MAESGRVWTIGYEGRSVDAFLDTLDSASIDLVVDIRTKAFSRKSGFSKGPLARRLGERGVQYIHLPELGMPLHLLALRPSLDDNTPILEAYRAGMSDRTGGIEQLCTWATSVSVCLLCFEAEVSQCHRSVVAEHLRKERRLKIHHL